MRIRWIMAAVCLAALTACSREEPAKPASAKPAPLVVSAAMSLRQVMVAIGQAYERGGGAHVAFNFAGSNTLARQIIEGAPVDVFISADEAQMRLAEQSGAIVPDSRVDLLSNQLVVIVPSDRPRPLASVTDLTGPGFKRIAMGDPAAVPVGVYAKRYLEWAGVWGTLAPRIVPMTNVRAVVGAVENGGADAGFVYRTDARLSPHVTVAFEVPLGNGPVIEYPVALVAASKQPAAARRFLDYLQGAEARGLFEQAGFIAHDAGAPPS